MQVIEKVAIIGAGDEGHSLGMGAVTDRGEAFAINEAADGFASKFQPEVMPSAWIELGQFA